MRAGVGRQAGVDPGYSVKISHPEMATWPVKMPSSTSLSDAIEAFLKAKGQQGVDEDDCGILLPNGTLCTLDDDQLQKSIADLGLKPDGLVKIMFEL